MSVEDIFGEDELSSVGWLRRIKGANLYLPERTRWGGWFGRDAKPGEVLVAFVGDRLASTDQRDWPPLFWGRTGGLLLRSLGESRHRCYFTNATKDSDQHSKDLRAELLEFVMPEAIIALGGNAAKRLTVFDVPCVKIPHPSWWLRFNSKTKTNYRNEIQKGIETWQKLRTIP